MRQQYIAFLRGINVSGQKLIKMEMLRKALAELPFANVTTYIQSGNILFEADLQIVSDLENLITLLIRQHFGFDVPVIVITPAELVRVVEGQPFSQDLLSDPAQPYVAFLRSEPDQELLKILLQTDFGLDQIVTSGRVLYLHYHDSAGKTKLTNQIIEKILKVNATTRNWKTINKLIQLSENN